MNYSTSSAHKIQVLALGFVVALGSLTIVGCAYAQVTAPSGKSPEVLPPLPPPIYEPGELPALPLPTDEQLKKGRELLDKIAYVITNIPLTDPDAVLEFFGFTDLRKYQYPDHIDVVPKGKSGGYKSIAEMVGTGFEHISVQPWINSSFDRTLAHLSARISTKENCVSIDDVRRVFGALSLNTSNNRPMTAHAVQRPKPLHGIGNLSFYPLKNPTEYRAGMTFSFDYQTCAIYINSGYSPKTN